jgi:REP element-mobilizing transposase RayT
VTRRGATLEHALFTTNAFHKANTYTSLHYHIVFSTKNREHWLRPDIEERVWSYLGGIAGESDEGTHYRGH